MTSQTAFQPLSKNDVAILLRISPRSVENWVNGGILIAPAKLGNRVYWHPAVFYQWLEEQLTKQHVAQMRIPSGPEHVEADEVVEDAVKPQPRRDPHKNDLVRLREKNEKQLFRIVDAMPKGKH